MSASDAQKREPMGFKEISARYLEPASQWVMVIGIVALCQPWIAGLHSYGVTIILAGLIGFNVFSKIKPGPKND
jgi:type IV secretory pathway VirB2 component (pilin)